MNKKLLLAFVVLSIITTKIYSTSISVLGSIFSNTTWNADTIKIKGDVYIYNGSKLNITSGTIIEVHGFYKISVVNGSINASGTINDSIYFQHVDTTGLKNFHIPNGGWKGIDINPWGGYVLTDSSILQYCSFKNVKNNYQLNGSSTSSYSTSIYSAIYICKTSLFRISNCSFTANYLKMNLTPVFPSMGDMGLIACDFNASGIITNNTFKSNTYGSQAIFLRYQSNAFIHQNIFCYNESNYGGAICAESSDPIITNNRVTNNFSTDNICGTAGGMGILLSKANPYIANNLIANNSCSTRGGAIHIMNNSTPTIVNNTIVNNYSDWEGSAIYIVASTVLLKNNIIWGNVGYNNYLGTPMPGEQIYIYPSNTPYPDIYNCCIENGLSSISFGTNNTSFNGVYSNNINSNPLFFSTSNGAGHLFNGLTPDWRLQSSSPCINTGTLNNLGNLPAIDLWYNPRITGISIEIGAYEARESVGETGINSFTSNSQLSLYPNPANNYFILNYEKHYEKATITLVNTLGQTVESKTFFNSENIQFDVSNYSKGVYYISAIFDDKTVSEKIIVQ